MRKFIVFVVPLAFLFSCTCNHNKEIKSDLPKVSDEKLPEVKIRINRYENAIFNINQNDFVNELKRIQPEYAVFLDGDLNDKQNQAQLLEYLNDHIIKDNYEACKKRFADISGIEASLSRSLSYYKYYFPGKKIPEVYSYISGGDFDQPVKYGDSVLIIALDMYLGKKFPLYTDYKIPYYKMRMMDTAYLVRDCMEEIAINTCSADNKDATFLDQMVSMGKVMFILEATMPQTPDSIKMKYSQSKLDWCFKNEGNIWSFFIENKILYKKDRDTFLKFFGDGPFTNTFGKESPPRIAIWVGWQIIRAYMKEVPDADIKKLVAEKDSQKILQVSKYKPKKEK